MRAGRALVLGYGGQDGRYVRAACERRGLEVVGLSRSTSPACDVASFDAVESAVREAAPTLVFQLAADSSTSHEALFHNHAAIASGAVNVLESVKRHAPGAAVVLASSGLVFENDGRAIHESHPFAAKSPYAAARIYSTYLARYFRSAFGVRAKVAHLFHHESPERGERHTSMRIALAAARAAAGLAGRIEIGDPTVEKEWSFAGDVAEALVALAESPSVDECVVGTGVGHTIGDWLTACFGRVGLEWREHVDVRTDFVPEYRRLVSDPRTLLAAGWTPIVGFEALADRMMEAATDRVASGLG